MVKTRDGDWYIILIDRKGDLYGSNRDNFLPWGNDLMDDLTDCKDIKYSIDKVAEVYAPERINHLLNKPRKLLWSRYKNEMPAQPEATIEYTVSALQAILGHKIKIVE